MWRTRFSEAAARKEESTSNFKFIFAQFSRLRGGPSHFQKVASPWPQVLPGQVATSRQDQETALTSITLRAPPRGQVLQCSTLAQVISQMLACSGSLPSSVSKTAAQTSVLAVSVIIPSSSPNTLRPMFSYNFKLLKELMSLWNTWVLKNREYRFGKEKRLRLEISSSFYKVTIQVVIDCCCTLVLENPRRTGQSSHWVLEINNALNLGHQMPESLCSECKQKQNRSPDIQFPISSLPQTQSLGKPVGSMSFGLMVKLWQQHFGPVAWETETVITASKFQKLCQVDWSNSFPLKTVVY